MMSIYELLKLKIKKLKSSNIDSAELDAEIILRFVTKKSKEFLLANSDFELSNREVIEIKKLIERRENDEPIAYITGKKEFFGLDFFVTKDTLIPRPETEILVEEGLKFLEYRIQNKELRILDVGTGSGNIIISIIKAVSCQLLAASYWATDISTEALKVAKKNAKFHQVDKKIKFIKSDLFANKKLPKKFDLIIANLPYVPKKASSQQLKANSLFYEPQNAIFADDNGTAIIKKFLDQVTKRINVEGIILIEVDPRNAGSFRNYAKRYFKKIELKKDLAGRDRVIIISKL